MVTWSAVLGLIALILLGTAVFLWVKQNMRKPSENLVQGSIEIVVDERVESQFESPTEDEALDLVKRGLAIRNPADVTECFRPGTASPEKVVDFLTTMEEMDGPVQGLKWLSSMDANGLLIDGVLVKTQLGDQMKNRLALLTPDAKGVWRIDFGAFARTVEPSYQELLETGASEGLVRVIVAVDTYYNGPFADDSKWVCYGMASPDVEVVMLGYCKRESPQAAAMERIFENKTRLSLDAKAVPQRATLKVRRVEGAELRQFEITRVLAEDWVVSDVEFDSRFE